MASDRLPQGQPPRVFQVADDEFETGSGGSLGEALDLRRLAHVVLKRWWVLAAAVIGCLLIGVIVTLLSTPIYRASTVLQIDREAAQVVSVEGVLPAEEALNAQEFYQTQYGLLRSRSLAERVIDQLGLAEDPTFFEDNRRGAANTEVPDSASNELDAEEQRRLAVEQLLENLRVNPELNSRLVTVSYDSPDPRLAEQITNVLAENFIASNLERRFEASSYAREFLEGRIDELRERLEASERELVAYAADQQIINIPSASGASDENRGRSLLSSSLESLNTSLAAATSARVAAEQRWRAAQASSGLGLSEVLASPTIQALREQRATLSGQYQQQLQQFQPEFPAMQQLQAQITELDAQIASEAGDIRASLAGEYRSALASERALQGEIAQLRGQATNLDQRSIRYNILVRELDTNRQLYDALLQRYREIGIAGGVGTNNVSVVDRAEVPVEPEFPRPLLNMALAGVFGLMLGGALIFGLEYLDETLKVPADVEGKLGLPLLGSVPLLDSQKELERAMQDPRSGFSEAYHSIRSAIQFSRRSGTPKSMLITSSQPAEGKTTSSVAIARAFARAGQSVLLIDGDVRDPSLHKIFGVPNRVGFSSLLTGSAALAEAVQETDQTRLFLMSSGPRPPSPADLLSGDVLDDVVAKATEAYHLVIIDGPPVMGLADAPILGHAVESVIFVSAANGVRRANARTAIARLHAAGADVLGGILEKFDSKKASLGGYGYEYSYSYDYGIDPGPGKQARPGAR